MRGFGKGLTGGDRREHDALADCDSIWAIVGPPRPSPGGGGAGGREKAGRPLPEAAERGLRGHGSGSRCPVRGDVLPRTYSSQAKRAPENTQDYDGVRSGISTNAFSPLAAAWGKEASVTPTGRNAGARASDTTRPGSHSSGVRVTPPVRPSVWKPTRLPPEQTRCPSPGRGGLTSKAVHSY